MDSESYDTNLKLRFGGEQTLSEYPSKITIKNDWLALPVVAPTAPAVPTATAPFSKGTRK